MLPSENKLSTARHFKCSKFLLRRENGKPIAFFCDFKSDDLNAIITKGGGLLVGKEDDADYLLCEKAEDNTINNGYLPLDYVVSCVKKNCLINTLKYRDEILNLLRPSSSHGKVDQVQGESDQRTKFLSARRSSPKTKCGDACTDTESGDSDFPERSFKDSPQGLKSRLRYTEADDYRMLKYLAEHYSYLGGNVVWKRMASLKITDHTFQSMRAHFFKVLLPSLERLDIPREWKKKLIMHRSSSSSMRPQSSLFEEMEAWRDKKKSGNVRLKSSEKEFSETDDDDEEDRGDLGKKHVHNYHLNEEVTSTRHTSQPDSRGGRESEVSIHEPSSCYPREQWSGAEKEIRPKQMDDARSGGQSKVKNLKRPVNISDWFRVDSKRKSLPTKAVNSRGQSLSDEERSRAGEGGSCGTVCREEEQNKLSSHPPAEVDKRVPLSSSQGFVPESLGFEIDEMSENMENGEDDFDQLIFTHVNGRYQDLEVHPVSSESSGDNDIESWHGSVESSGAREQDCVEETGADGAESLSTSSKSEAMDARTETLMIGSALVKEHLNKLFPWKRKPDFMKIRESKK